LNWNAHVDRLEASMRESGPGDVTGSGALADILDAVTDLVALLTAREDETVRHVRVASMHLAFAREHVMPVGPSAVPGDLPLPIAFRDARRLLSVALEILGSRDRWAAGEADAASVITRSRTRNHLRAAARALGREVLLPAQRGSQGARTV
jgi:hypothetical protein